MFQSGLMNNLNQTSTKQVLVEDYILHLNFRQDLSIELEENKSEDILIQVNPELFQKNYSERPEFIR
jgi:hypothetical protein